MNIGLKTFLKYSGNRLPYDAEIEYLESTGTQWIDTGVISQNNLVYDFDVYEYTLNNQRRFFGFKEGTSWLSPGMNDANYGNSWFYVDFASTEARGMDTRPTKTFNKYHFDFTDGKASFSFNSTRKWTSNRVGTYNGSRHIFIFDLDSIFMTSSTHGIGRISFFQIRKDGILVRDLIPVRFTNELGQREGALYDRRGVGGMNPDGSSRTDGLYRNRGTGNFVIGPDIARQAYT